jgi:hypothetical protein
VCFQGHVTYRLGVRSRLGEVNQSTWSVIQKISSRRKFELHFFMVELSFLPKLS